MIVLSLVLAASLGGAPKAGSKQTSLKITVKPESAVVYVDNKRRGTGAKPITVSVTPGRHAIRVVYKKDEHTDVISVKAGEQKSWNFELTDDVPKAPEPAPTEEGGGEAEKPKEGSADAPPAPEERAEATVETGAPPPPIHTPIRDKPRKKKKGSAADPLDLP